MKRWTVPVAALIAAVILSPAVHAQAFRTYLASYGMDTNPCSVSAPCRLLPAALNAVLDKGEIWILDSANFNAGQVDISKNVSILAIPGATASIVSAGNFPAVTISTAGLKVSMRNVVIANNANNPGTYGIQLNANSELSLEECVFSNMVFDAVNVNAGKANVRNSMFRENGNFAVSAYNGASVNISGSEIFGGYGGVDAQNSTAATTTFINVADSTIANQSQFGAHAVTGASTAASRVMLTRSTVYGVGSGATHAGLYANSLTGTPVIMVANSAVNGNYINFSQQNNGVIRTLGNNYIGDGLAGDTGTLTSFAPR
ncbi:MAG TPA: hypothetical protein VFE23_07925 [Usitatibacter sp.]|jgi:hypothetical protein|nr:hypothetical protein [Usitatibacter sp.]